MRLPERLASESAGGGLAIALLVAAHDDVAVQLQVNPRRAALQEAAELYGNVIAGPPR